MLKPINTLILYINYKILSKLESGDYMINIYEVIAEKQKELGLNNTELCKYLGVTRQWLCGVQYGVQRVFNVSTCFLLNNKLGIPMEVLNEYNESIKENRLKEKEDD